MRYVLALACLLLASSGEAAIFRHAAVARSKVVVSSGVRPIRGGAFRSGAVSKSCVVVNGAVRCTP